MVNITIGADPEFNIFTKNGNSFVRADGILPDSTRARIGCDGCSATGEMRPRYSSDWLNVFKDVQKIITVELPRRVNPERYSIYAGSGKYAATGGHIHIGGQYHPTRTQLNAFNTFLYEKLNRVSNTSNRSYYNSPGQWREQPHGYEYRSTLSWLSTPKICKGALCIGHIIGRNPDIEFTSLDVLLSLATEAEKIVIGEFYAELEQLQTEHIVLENVDLYQAWAKDKAEPEVRKTRANAKYGRLSKAAYQITFNNGDFNLSDIFEVRDSNSRDIHENFINIVRCELPIHIQGARGRNYNNTEYVVYLKEGLLTDTSTIGCAKVRFVTLNENDWECRFGTGSDIALSYDLRTNERYCRNVLYKVIMRINQENIRA